MNQHHLLNFLISTLIRQDSSLAIGIKSRNIIVLISSCRLREIRAEGIQEKKSSGSRKILRGLRASQVVQLREQSSGMNQFAKIPAELSGHKSKQF
jgi:hypothetical protein